MKNLEAFGIATALGLGVAGCGDFEIGKGTKGYLAADGYSLPCSYIDDFEKKARKDFLVNKEGQCAGADTEFVVEPAQLAEMSDQVIIALNCAYGKLIQFERKTGFQKGPQDNTIFWGGKALGTKNVPLGSTMTQTNKFYSYVVDTLSDGTMVPACHQSNSLIHEPGHEFIDVADYKLEGKGYEQYELKPSGHDPDEEGTLMVEQGVCHWPRQATDTSRNWSEGSASLVADGFDVSNTGMTKTEVKQYLMTVGDRCEKEFAAIDQLEAPLN